VWATVVRLLELRTTLRVRIHRGAHEIGGSAVEVEAADGHRVVLDLGKPLAAGLDEVVPLPEVDGLTQPDASLLGVVLSHLHLDHVGLMGQVDPRVPVFIGEEAARILEAAAFFSSAAVQLQPTGFLKDAEPFELGPFTITPLLADHSAFDAYALVVDADGRRLFYSGDLRGHGRKAKLFERMLHAAPPAVDVLLLEGTHVRTKPDVDEGRPFSTETDLELHLTELCAKTSGLVAVLGSAQNIDRLVTAFRAARASGRRLVVDLYTATVAAATRESIPQPGFAGLAVFVPQRQRARIARSQQFERVRGIANVRLFPEQLAEQASELMFYGTSSAAADLLDAGALRQGGLAVWSLWQGYLREPSGLRLQDALREAGVDLVHVHTSGHASVTDLQRLVTAVNPGRVVPIHTEAPARFVALFPRSELHDDGEWWDV